MAKKKRLGMWDYIVWVLMAVTFGVLYYTYRLRAVNGIESYYSNPTIIFINSFAYVFAFALVTGYVVSKILQKTK